MNCNFLRQILCDRLSLMPELYRPTVTLMRYAGGIKLSPIDTQADDLPSGGEMPPVACYLQKPLRAYPGGVG
ncbi:MAG: hypothetical protein HC785_04955 [Calothrix sp. CSU_2_0]|nr:hypothetical protein [Calothrix sp. CSU_2_0]